MPTATLSDANPQAAQPGRLLAEGLVRVRDAARLLGKAPKTAVRYCLTGVRLADGSVLYLEHVRVGGGLKTTRQAVERFVMAQQAAVLPAPPQIVTEADRKRRANRALDQLRRMGVYRGPRTK